MTVAEVAVADVTATITTMYRALGNRPAFDAHLHPRLSIWESDAPDLMHGLDALDALRDTRAAGAAAGVGSVAPTSVAPESFLVETWDGTALARYVLRAVYADDRADECFRVTDVLRYDDFGWRIVHHHAEAVR